MQAVRPAAEGEEEQAQEQAVREEAAEVKREVAKAHEEEAVPEEKDVAVVGEEAEAEAEAETEGEGEAEAEAEAGASAKKNRIQVSTNKKPLYFYVNLAKVCLYCSQTRRHAWSYHATHSIVSSSKDD